MYEGFAKQNNSPVEDMLSEQGRENIKRVEGILIEAFRKKYGHFPPWKGIGGSTIRELSQNPEWAWYEITYMQLE